MKSRHFGRRWTVLGLVVGLVLSGMAPAAAARKAPSGWDQVHFSGNWMFYEAPIEATLPETGTDLSYLLIRAYDGEFKPGKRTPPFPASVLVAEVSGGECIADDASATGYVMKVVHLIGATEVGDAITFESSHAGSLKVISFAMTGTRRVWEAEYSGPGGCRGITVLDEQTIERTTLDVALVWSSVAREISSHKGRKTTTVWQGVVESATGVVGGVVLRLPFGENDGDEYVAQSCHSSGAIMIPTGTFG